MLNSTCTFQRPKFCVFHSELILLIPGQRSHSDLRNSYSKNIARTSWKIVIGIWWSHLVSNTQQNLSYLSCLYTWSEVVKIRYHYIHSFVKLPCSSHDVVLSQVSFALYMLNSKTIIRFYITLKQERTLLRLHRQLIILNKDGIIYDK